jgi:hypothetical protein
MSAVEKAHNNVAIVKSREKKVLELSTYTPTDFEFAEFFGGGSEYLPFRRPPFSLIRLFEQEGE